MKKNLDKACTILLAAIAKCIANMPMSERRKQIEIEFEKLKTMQDVKAE